MKKLALLLPWLTACSVSLKLPEDTVVGCRTAADCPAGLVCKVALQRCIADVNNAPPTVSVAPVGQSIGPVELHLIVTDPESNRVKLSATRGDGAVVTLTPDTVESSPSGAAVTVTWDAPAAFGGTSLRDDIVLTLVPSDDSNIGAPVSTAPFAFGNDAPALLDVQIDQAVGLTPISLVVDDQIDAEIYVDLLEFSPRGDFSDTVLVPTSALSGEAGPYYLLTGSIDLAWDTLPHANLEATAAKLRLRVRDDLGALSTVVTSAAFAVQNSPQAAIDAEDDSFGPIGRPVNALVLSVAVDDPNFTAHTGLDNGDAVSVGISFALSKSAPFVPATLTSDSTPHADLQEPQTIELTWDIATDAAAGVGGLSLTNISPNQDVNVPASIVAYVPEVFIRVALTDRSGRTVLQDLGPLAIGDDAPQGLLANTVQSSGLIPLLFQMQDSAADPATIDLTVQVGSDPAVELTDYLGATSGLTTAASFPSAPEHIVVFDSIAALGKRNLTNVQVALRAKDCTATYCLKGAPFFVSFAQLANQFPPSILSATAARAESIKGDAPIAIRYVVADNESDAVDIRCELQASDGAFLPCKEYRTPQSEGTHDLASAPQTPLGGGLAHTYVLDPSQLTLSPRGGTVVRLSVSDGENAVTSQREVVLTQPLAPLSSNPTETGFATRDYVDVGEYCTGLAAGRVDGDGPFDVAVSTASSSNLQAASPGDGNPPPGFRTLLGKYRDGSYLPPILALAGTDVFNDAAHEMQGIVAGKFDNDGHTDFVTRVANVGLKFHPTSVGSLSIAKSTFGSANFVLGVASGDLDNDGDDDLAVVVENNTGTEAYILTNQSAPGALSFATSAPLPADMAPAGSAVVIADIDGDGDRDIAAPPALFLNAGGGNFAYDVRLVDVGADVLRAANLDADPAEELVAIRSNINKVSVYDLYADSVYRVRDYAFPPVSLSEPGLTDVAIGDIDGDGSPDIVVTDRFFAYPAFPSGGVHVLNNGVLGGNPTGVFSRQSSEAWPWVNRVQIVDVDGDGQNDLVGCGTVFADQATQVNQNNPISGRVEVWPARRGGSNVDLMFEPPATISLKNPFLSAIDFTDYNGDERADLVVQDGGAVSLFASDPSQGPLALAYASPEAMLQTVGQAYALGDLDGDQLDDLVHADFSDGALVEHAEADAGVSRGQFTIGPRLFSGSTVRALAVADLDRDGRSDVAAIAVPNQLLVAYQNDDGSFVEEPASGVAPCLSTSTLEVAPTLTPVHFSLQPNDDLDLVVGFESLGYFAVLQKGAGNTYSCETRSLPNGPGQTMGPIAIADINTDGLLDVVVSQRDAALRVYAYFGCTGGAPCASGLSTTRSPLFTSDPTAAFSAPGLAVQDLDGDGALDIIAGLQDGASVFRAYLARGVRTGRHANGSFGAVSAKLMPGDTHIAKWRDLNGDGVLDQVRGGSGSRVSIDLGRIADARASQQRGLGGADVVNVALVHSAERDRFTQGAYANASALTVARASALAGRVPTLENGLLAITEAYSILGAERHTTVNTELGPRLRIESRFGPRLLPDAQANDTQDFTREGLDLLARVPRGVIVSFDVDPTLQHLLSSPSALVVAGLVRTYFTAGSFAHDPMSQQPDADDYLPCRLDPSTQACSADALRFSRQELVYLDYQPGELGSTPGAQFSIDTSVFGQPKIKVLIDRNIELQVFSRR